MTILTSGKQVSSSLPPLQPLKDEEDDFNDIEDDGSSAIDINTNIEDDAAIALMLKNELYATNNQGNPFDLNTPYGQYACIQAVLQQYKNRLRLEKLVSKPDVDPLKDAQALQAEYDKWEQEVQIMAERQTKFQLKPTLLKQKEAISKAERMLYYQPMDYAGACAALGMDPERPQLEGMKPTYVFQPWQVTGIYRVVQIYRDPLKPPKCTRWSGCMCIS